jgi:osmotically-inducible protein OsmY
VQEVLANVSTDRLPSRAGIRVVGAGDVVVLQGKVSDDHERRLAEMIIRLTPGVREISNELEVSETAPPPRPLP